MYKGYTEYGKGKYKDIVFSTILTPVLLDVIWQIKHASNDNDDMKNTRWYRAIEKKMSEKNMSLDDDNPITIVQGLFSDPVARSFDTIHKNMNAVTGE